MKTLSKISKMATLTILVINLTGCGGSEEPKPDDNENNQEEFPQVTADFSNDLDVIWEGATVTFTSTSDDDVTSWEWAINGEVKGSQKILSFEFADYGEFDVTLTVSNADHSDSKTAEDLIKVLPAKNMTAFFPFNGNMEESLNGYDAEVEGINLGTSNRFSESNKGLSLNVYSDELGDTFNWGRISQNTLKTPTFTVSTWVKWADQAAPYIGGNSGVLLQPILTTLNNAGFAYIEGLNLCVHQNKLTAFRYAENGSMQTLARAPMELELDEWTHVVASFTKDSTYLYVNGELATQVYAGFDIEYKADADIVIGSYNYEEVFDGRFNGALDDMRFYDEKLDATAVKLLYQYDSGD